MRSYCHRNLTDIQGQSIGPWKMKYNCVMVTVQNVDAGWLAISCPPICSVPNGAQRDNLYCGFSPWAQHHRAAHEYGVCPRAIIEKLGHSLAWFTWSLVGGWGGLAARSLLLLGPQETCCFCRHPKLGNDLF